MGANINCIADVHYVLMHSENKIKKLKQHFTSNFYKNHMIKESMVEYILLLLNAIVKMESYDILSKRGNLTFIYKSNTDPVTDIKYVPHHVLIVYGSSYCSGSLIGSRTVVTAASCFDNNKNEPVIVKVGSSSMTGSGQIISVIEYKTHEYYKYLNSFDNDIALVMLRDHVVFGKNVSKTILIEPDVAFRLSSPVTVTGWGGTDLPVKYLNLILQSQMVLVDKIECLKQFGRLMSPSNFCAKYVLEGHLSDNGGGAIYNKLLLVGILSYGATTEHANTAILTNVSYFYRWIMLNSKRFSKKYCRIKQSPGKDLHNTEYIET